MTHAWGPTEIAPARLDRKRPAVMGWPHCSNCGAQASLVGARLYYRPTSADEWTPNELACGTPQKSDT